MKRSARATTKPRRRFGIPPRGAALIGITAVVIALLGGVPAATAAPGPVGNGFTVTPGDLAFILKQIKISERHATTLTASNQCGTLVAQPGDNIPDAEQVPDILTSYGLRTVDGSCNNLKDEATTRNFAAADQVFPRLTTPVWRSGDPAPTNPAFAPTDPTYQGTRNVVDSQPRTVSNLIVDQTSTNPAAIAAAQFPVRAQGGNPVFACTKDPVLADDGVTVTAPGVPADCVPSHKTLFIENVTTDVGLSPPYNSIFTFFGQFFDHGVDQTVKSGSSVFVPLKADDPLRTLGPDGIAGTNCGTPTAKNCDEVPASQAFMVLTRAQNQAGGEQNATNTDTPWVDQSQTYTSHASHQVFLREYTAGTGTPGPNNAAAVATGELLHGLGAGLTYDASPDMRDGESTWASVKKQAHDLLGLRLVDADVTNIPMLAVDPYGKFLPGAHGLPQYVRQDGTLLEGQLDNPTTTTVDETVPVPANVVHFDTPFVGDIAHNADPSPDPRSGAVPTPDNDGVNADGTEKHTVQTDFTKQPSGTYDDELLASHAACGDGRCNENIALTSIHQVFHSEHNRLVGYIKNVLENDSSAAGVAALAQWKAIGVAGANGSGTGSYNYGERLFQAARFITEMEYQHLVFEEFARKVQPAVRPFHVYSPDINPAIKAEFAHAVYRFGHSMLDDTVARTNTSATGTKTDNSVPLLKAFLNPPALYDGGTAGTLSAAAGAGSVFMGSSDQPGNELDEFVTETLRNNLLGLPLDLPTINMARAREAGVPPLNDVRRQIFAQTNDGQLAPYTSWTDFRQHLKHPESLINFVAAYGQHPDIVNATTLVAKRNAARAIVDPQPAQAGPDGVLGTVDDIPADSPPADAAEFMFGTGGWADDANGRTTTGLDDVDLWVGGLAEVTNLFGGLLGSTFNYVFQTQLEDLQDGDRLYYLARTPGLSLRTQLEGNSFSEMIQRNTDNTNTLKADAFATADCKFQLANLNGTPAGFTQFGSTVADDPTTTDCDESLLLLRKPDGTIQYRAINTVDPSGINGQSVYNGTDGADRVFGGNDNDTFWGGKGNDIIEGNGGDDVALGGDGNDIITDLGGADVPKGGPGNDAIDAGIGDDIPMGNDGADFINAGANDNETFAGEGTDFVIAGQGADAVFGDGGDDWIEGGTGQDLLQGDHGAPFFDDPGEAAPGNDIFVGQVGENDYDAEGGDDVMSQNAAVDRNAGAGGFDWAFHQYNTTAAKDDMMINNNLGGLPIQLVVNRDRWQETEADSGGKFNDTILGTDGVLATPRLIDGRTGGFSGCDALDAAGVARIKGLDALLPPIAQWPGTAADTATLSAGGRCPLTGPVWGEGDILLGGPGTDTITGRAGDEIIDGDRELRTAISVRTNPADPNTEIGRTDLMENKATSGNFGANTVNMTLQQAVFAGRVDPGNLVGVREIVNKETNPADCGATAPKNCDTATFAGPQAQYSITANPNGSVTVVDTTSTPPTVAAPATGDGSDTLFNVEQLKFSNATVAATLPAAPTITSVVPGNASATVNFTGPAGATGFTLSVRTGSNPVPVQVLSLPATATNRLVTGLTNGTAYSFTVAAVNAIGTGPESVAVPATPVAPAAGAPTVTARTPAANAVSVAVGGNVTATFSPAVTGVSGTTFQLQNATTNALIPAVVTINGAGTVATLNPTGNLAADTRFTVTLTGGATAIRSTVGSTPLATTTWSFTTGPAPTVAARAPGVNATGVAVANNVTATFSEAVTGVSGTTFVLRNATTNATIGAAVSQNGTTNQWILDPTANLTSDTRYTVTLTGGAAAIRDAAGNPLATTTWSFTTGPAPTVSARAPGVNSTGVTTTANVTATFSEAVNGVSGTTFLLRNVATNALIPAAVTRNGTTNQWILNPTDALAGNTQFRVTLTGGAAAIRDVAGNALTTVSWNFTTGP
jgi:Ca2+-binding RTX toxin-like protein